MTDLSRRTLLCASAVAPLVAAATACAAPADPARVSGSRVLVAYFTRSGNTQVVAGTIQRTLGADLFEIRPATAYPEDYEQTVEQARRERDAGFEPPLAETVTGLETYETIFLGFPIWGETAPPVIRSFLKAHDLNGKALRPFITTTDGRKTTAVAQLLRSGPCTPVC